MTRRERVLLAAVALGVAAVLCLCARQDASTPGRRAGWVGLGGIVTRQGRAACREHGQADCTAAWLEAHAAEHGR